MPDYPSGGQPPVLSSLSTGLSTGPGPVNTQRLPNQTETPHLPDPSFSPLSWSSVLPSVWKDTPSPLWGFPVFPPRNSQSPLLFPGARPTTKVPWDPQTCWSLLPSPASCPIWSSPFLGPEASLQSLGWPVCLRASQRQLLFFTALLGGAF